MGMVAAARVSRALGRCDAATVDRLAALLKRIGLPTEIPGSLSAEALSVAMLRDKKTSDGRIRFVCLEGIGRTAFVDIGAQEIVQHLS
jgi:3-dehydroquinate synthase